MENRILGKNLVVSPVGLWCMGFSHAYGKATDADEAVKTIRQALDFGYTFFDTAECYIGENEDGSMDRVDISYILTVAWALRETC